MEERAVHAIKSCRRFAIMLSPEYYRLMLRASEVADMGKQARVVNKVRPNFQVSCCCIVVVVVVAAAVVVVTAAAADLFILKLMLWLKLMLVAVLMLLLWN